MSAFSKPVVLVGAVVAICGALLGSSAVVAFGLGLLLGGLL